MVFSNTSDPLDGNDSQKYKKLERTQEEAEIFTQTQKSQTKKKYSQNSNNRNPQCNNKTDSIILDKYQLIVMNPKMA